MRGGGIRLKKGLDFPYHEARGFPEEFVLLETHLCSYDEMGRVCRDPDGNPILDCMCGNVIRGRINVTKDFFTVNGSFWTNSTTRLLASSTEEDRQARTRNRCNGEGYESVALIPLSMGRERYGLLQMNDRRAGLYSPQMIAQWERLAGYLSVALSKFLADEALDASEERYLNLFESIEESAAFFEYVLDGDEKVVDFICRDVNPAGLAAMGYDSKDDVLGRRMGGFGPDRTLAPDIRAIAEMRRTGKTVVTDIHLTAGDRDFITAIIPIDKDHFILTSRDETDIKGMRTMADNDRSRLKAIMDVLPTGLILVDENGAMVAVNEIAKNSWGGCFPMAQNVEGYDIYKAWWHDTGREITPGEWAAALAIREGKTTLGQVLTVQGFDGVKRSIINNAAPIRTREGKIVGAVIATQDITESMEQEESLRIANDKLKLLDSINRHDIRNQLTILRGNLDLVRRAVSDPEGQKRLEVAGRAAEMIEKHVNFAKQYQELGRTSPVWQSLDTEITKALEGYDQIDLADERGTGLRVRDTGGFHAPEGVPESAGEQPPLRRQTGQDKGPLRIGWPGPADHLRGPGRGNPCRGKGEGLWKRIRKRIWHGAVPDPENLGISGITIEENGLPGQGVRFEDQSPPGPVPVKPLKIPWDLMMSRTE